MQKKLLTAFIAVLAVVAVAGGVRQAWNTGLIASMLPDGVGLGSNEKSVTNSKTGEKSILPKNEYQPTEAKMGESFVMSGIEVTVDSVRVGKEPGGLPALSDRESIANLGAKLDASGAFTDNHNYVDVQVTCKNTGDYSEGNYPNELRLNSFWLQTPDGKSSMSVAEPEMCDVVDFARPVPSSGLYELADGESVTAHIGFVLTDEQLKDLQGKLYFLPDFTGTAIQYPKEANAHWVKLDYTLS